MEVLGFRRTLYVAAAFNLVIASASASLGWRRREAATVVPSQREPGLERPRRGRERSARSQPHQVDPVLDRADRDGHGVSGLRRAFTQVLRTQVYSFASVVS